MYKFQKTTVFIAGMLAVGGLAAAPIDDYKTAHRKAVAALDIAASVDSEWRDSRKMLKQAKQLADAGNYEKAIALATKAKRQGEMGYNQGVHEKSAGHPSYLLAIEAATTPMDDYQKAHDDAVAALNQAASVDSEWRDSRAMLKKSKKMADAGNLEQAVKLANKAKKQGELGYAQGVAEQNAGHPSYLTTIASRGK